MYKPLADSTLMNMSKKQIIEQLRIAEHNHRVCEESNKIQAENCKRLLTEERNKAIDDFYNKIIEAYEETKNIPQVEKATVHTIALEIMEQLTR